MEFQLVFTVIVILFFVSPNDGKLSIEDQLKGKQVNLTQFGRAMDELGINIIKAYSPQAKGRIERLCMGYITEQTTC